MSVSHNKTVSSEQTANIITFEIKFSICTTDFNIVLRTVSTMGAGEGVGGGYNRYKLPGKGYVA